jgi:hypothetical protein
MSVTETFLNKNKFTQLVHDAVTVLKSSYMDAILHICEKNNIDPQDVKKFVSPVIRDKLEAEARQLNLLPKNNTITFE